MINAGIQLPMKAVDRNDALLEVLVVSAYFLSAVGKGFNI